MHRNAPSSGFTIIELLIYMLLIGMMSSLIFGSMINYWRLTATSVNDNITLVQRADAADLLRSYLNPAAHLINQNSIADAHPMVGDPSDSTGQYWLLIHAVPGSTTLPASGSYTPVFYFTAPSVDSSKNFIMNGAQPYYDNFVLYLNGTKKQLRMRVLVNPGASGDRLKTTCPDAYVSSSCPADPDVSDDVSSVDTSYYSKSDIAINWCSSTDPVTNLCNGPDFAYVEVASLTVHLSRQTVIAGGASTANQVVVRVALRN